MKDIQQPSESQPKNGRFGRVPESDAGAISKLSHLQAHVYLVACMLANRKKEPLGLVERSMRQIAQLANSSHPRVIEAAKELEGRGLVRYEHGRLFVIHCQNMVPSENHSGSLKEPPRLHEGTAPVLSENHSSPQPTEQKLFPDPRNDLRNDRNGKERKQGRKRPRREDPPVTIFLPEVAWDKSSQQVVISPESKVELMEHLDRLRVEEGLKDSLSKKELQLSLGRLNGHLISNRHKRAKDTLPGLVRNWFENDLRTKNSRAGAYRGRPTEEPAGWSAIREHEEMERRNHGNYE